MEKKKKKKKKKRCSVRADPKRHGPYVSVETSPTIDDILWSVGNNLAASHRDLSVAGVDNCTLLKPPSTKSVFECARVCACKYVYCARVDFDPEDITVLN